MIMINIIYDDDNDIDVDVIIYVANDHGYDGDNINVIDHDSCESTYGS